MFDTTLYKIFFCEIGSLCLKKNQCCTLALIFVVLSRPMTMCFLFETNLIYKCTLAHHINMLFYLSPFCSDLTICKYILKRFIGYVMQVFHENIINIERYTHLKLLEMVLVLDNGMKGFLIKEQLDLQLVCITRRSAPHLCVVPTK